MSEKRENKPRKDIPTVLPSGFGVRLNSRNMIMLDFVDLDYDNNANVIGSYCLDEKMLKDLKSAIDDVLGKIKK